MSSIETNQRLADFSYLWKSGEWTLHEYHHNQSRVIFVFAAGRPSAEELLAVRAVPRRLLHTDGWFLVGAHGGRRQIKHLAKPGRVTVPGKRSDDLAPGTLNSILEQASPRRN